MPPGDMFSENQQKQAEQTRHYQNIQKLKSVISSFVQKYLKHINLLFNLTLK